MASPKKTRIQNIILMLASLAVGLGVSEAGLRIYLRNDYSVPNHRNFLLKKVWFDKHANLNSLGHRDHEFSRTKPADTFRILVVGDSLTYGQGIEKLDDLYTEILEKRLNQEDGRKRFEVLNVSERGYNVQDYLDVMRDKGLTYDPDLIVIGFYINDIEASDRNRPEFRFLPYRVHWFFSRLSFFYHYAYTGLNQLLVGRRYLKYRLHYTNPESEDWKRFTPLWKELLSLGQEKGIRTAVMILPLTSFLNDEHPFISAYDNVAALSKACGAEVLNIFPFLKGLKPKDLEVGLTDGHPNEAAHRIFAQAFYDFLMKNKHLLEKRE